jgi:hypothetical protein
METAKIPSPQTIEDVKEILSQEPLYYNGRGGYMTDTRFVKEILCELIGCEQNSKAIHAAFKELGCNLTSEFKRAERERDACVHVNWTTTKMSTGSPDGIICALRLAARLVLDLEYEVYITDMTNYCGHVFLRAASSS